MIKVVLFDLDGTLIDSSEGITRSVQYALKKYGIDEPDLAKLKCFIGPPLPGSFMKYYHFPEAQAKEAVGAYREYYRPTGIFQCCLYPGVEKCIRTLKEQGYLIGVASSKPEIFCKKILDHFGILELFDEVAGATEDGSIGTKEQVLNEVIRRFGQVPKDAMCLIGDTIYDVEGANRVGIKTIGVSFGFGDAQEMLDAGAVCICDHMDELPDAIASKI